MPELLDADDLVGDGVFGLVDAMSRFDPSRGAKFETFAAPRVRGAILEAQRARDWTPRKTRAHQARVESAIESSLAETGLLPTREELIGRAGRLAVRWVDRVGRPRKWTSLAAPLPGIPLDGGDCRDRCVADLIVDPSGERDHQRLVSRDWMRQRMRDLTRRERLIVTLFYEQAMSMKEIGRALGVTESRVSQLHSSIIERLRAKVTEDE